MCFKKKWCSQIGIDQYQSGSQKHAKCEYKPNSKIEWLKNKNWSTRKDVLQTSDALKLALAN